VPHDNALIALGFARYGLKRPVGRLFQGLFDAATYLELRRLPELFCGFQRQRERGPTLYPWRVPREPGPFTLLEASLGLEFNRHNNEIRCGTPCSAFLDEVNLRNLRLGESSLDLRVRRHKGEVSVDVPRRQGGIQVSVVFSRV
jgi:glycogen debranching enzyme